ncbi:MAG TPA: hypothetical protein VGF21_10515, partial [Thermoleophilaceae bacterium]
MRRAVYAVGPPGLNRLDEVMAAVLSCGSLAAASYLTAAGVLGVRALPAVIEVSVPTHVRARPPGVRVHRRKSFEVGICDGIPVTSPVQTLLDLATR